MVRPAGDEGEVPQYVTPLISTKQGKPFATRSAYPSTSSSILNPLTRVRRKTVLCSNLFSRKMSRQELKRSQKSRCRGRSIFRRLSLLLASILTYNCVTRLKSRNCCGCCALQTKKLEILSPCNSPTNSLIRGQKIGSPTRLSAQ